MQTQLVNELRQNARLRIGLSLIILITGLYYVLDLRDDNAGLAEQLHRLQAKKARILATTKQQGWPERLEQAKSIHSKAEKRLWDAPTLALAQANYQDWLKQQLLLAKAQRPNIKVGDVEQARSNSATGKTDDTEENPLPEGINRIPAKIEMDFTPSTLNDLLEHLEGSTRLVVIESLNVKSPRVTLLVAAYHHPGASQPSTEQTH